GGGAGDSGSCGRLRAEPESLRDRALADAAAPGPLGREGRAAADALAGGDRREPGEPEDGDAGAALGPPGRELRLEGGRPGGDGRGVGEAAQEREERRLV